MKAKFEENRRRFCEANKIKIRGPKKNATNVTADIEVKKPVTEITEEIKNTTEAKATTSTVEQFRCVICQQTSEVGPLLHLGHLHTNSMSFFICFFISRCPGESLNDHRFCQNMEQGGLIFPVFFSLGKLGSFLDSRLITFLP